MKLSILAAHLGATLQGDPDTSEITSAAGLEDAGPGQPCLRRQPPGTSPLARTTQASAVLVEPTFKAMTAATLRIANPLPRLRPRPRSALSGAHLRSRTPSHRSHRPHRPDRPRLPHRRVRRHRRPRRHRPRRDAARRTSSSIPTSTSAATSSPTPTPSSANIAISATTSSSRTVSSSARDGFGFARHCARIGHARLVQDPPDRPHRHRGPRRSPGQLHH